MIMYTTRSTLLHKLQNNDSVGYQEFYTVYRNLIYSTALKSGVPAADTDDIIQAVMLGIFNNGSFLYSKTKHGLFRTYLGGVIHHKICDYFRNCPPAPEKAAPEEKARADFEEIFNAEYRSNLLELAIDELRRKVQPEVFETFELCFRRNLSDKEVAMLLNAKPNTVTIRKKRCLETLRTIITQLKTADPELDLPIL
ncbi:MAG: sigma-70 family RNA polymerase sigma factor [Lentisphaerae bacterium]|nr:sigma-70 family RNA polymerase sigma factor [Lentisphaerota bacterium]